MRSRILTFLAVEIVLLVTPMIWPTIPFELGMLLYGVAITIAALALVFWWSDKRAELKMAPSWLSKLPDVRVADSADIQKIFQGPERAKLVGLLQSGDVKGWARMKGHKPGDLTPLDPYEWQKLRLETVDIEGKAQTILPAQGAPIPVVRPWLNGGQIGLTRYYDVHFNRAQLKSIWPDMSF